LWLGHAPARIAAPVTGLERWDFPDRGAPHDAIQDAILNHPNFHVAQRASYQAALDYCQAHPDMQASISDMGSLLLCIVALYLDATGGITHRRLRMLMGKSGAVSAGRATALLWQLRRKDFIQTGHRNGKPCFLPTPAMRDAMQERMRHELRAAVHIEPKLQRYLAHFEGDALFRPIWSRLGDDLLEAATTVYPSLVNLHVVGDRAYGFAMTYAIAAADWDAPGTAAPAGAALARTYGTSRSHVFRILKLMEGFGFLDVRNNERFVTPRLREALREFQCMTYAATLRAAHRALRDITAANFSPVDAVN